MNIIEFCVDNYLVDKVSGDFEEARLRMWEDVSSLSNSLLRNKYVVVIRENDKNIITVEYEYSNYHYENQIDTKNPYWITKSDYYSVLLNKESEKEFYKKLP